MSIVKRITMSGLISLMLVGIALSSNAQLSPFMAIYYQNRYIYNPAMAGASNELILNSGYRQQWGSFPGSPVTGLLTADFGVGDKVGVGLNVNDEKAGLIRQTRIMGTYAYHLPLSETGKLNLGLSLGFKNSRIDYAGIQGDNSDTEIAQYNQLKPYVDGDLGIAYTNSNLYLGVAIPNLKSAFFRSTDNRFDADWMLFITAVSYKFPIQSVDNNFTLEPTLVYRIVQGYKNILDAGFNFAFDNYGLYMQGIYHSSNSFGLGLGFDQRIYALSFNYNMETGTLRNYTGGAFELGLKVRLFKVRK